MASVLPSGQGRNDNPQMERAAQESRLQRVRVYKHSEGHDRSARAEGEVMPNRCPVVPAEWIEETCAEAFVEREVRHGCSLRIGHTGAHKCHFGHEPATEALHEISVDMTTGERSTMMDEPDSPGHILSPAARAGLLSAAPSPSGLPGHWFTCSVGVARELRR